MTHKKALFCAGRIARCFICKTGGGAALGSVIGSGWRPAPD
nr:hypothetical protein [uncultured Acetobacter sp.]